MIVYKFWNKFRPRKIRIKMHLRNNCLNISIPKINMKIFWPFHTTWSWCSSIHPLSIQSIIFFPPTQKREFSVIGLFFLCLCFLKLSSFGAWVLVCGNVCAIYVPKNQSDNHNLQQWYKLLSNINYLIIKYDPSSIFWSMCHPNCFEILSDRTNRIWEILVVDCFVNTPISFHPWSMPWQWIRLLLRYAQ